VSFLAVLRPDDPQAVFDVPLCHVNLWSLGAVGPRRTLVLDIGLTVRAREHAVTSVTVALPVGTGDKVEDLASKVLDTEIAGLIFDKEVTKPAPAEIRFADRPTRVVRIRTTTSKQAEANRSKDFSVWTLELATPIDPGTSAYLRARFSVTGSGRTWQWQRSYLARTGAIVDFRICDVRGTATVAGGDELRGRIMPIGRAHVFVMVPAWLHQRATSPAPKYVRLLEGSVWAGYLGRAPEIRNRSKLVVYYWRHGQENPPETPPADADAPPPPPAPPVTVQHRLRALVQRPAEPVPALAAGSPRPGRAVSTDEPLRVFLELDRQPDPAGPIALLKTAAVLLVLALLLFDLPVRQNTEDAARWAWDVVTSVPGWLGITTVAAVVAFLLARNLQVIRTLLASLHKAFLAAEAALFRKLPK
jgi:hypothetical protein